MSKEQAEEWRRALTQILDKQIDPKVLIALLDDIKSGQIRIENGVLRIEKKIASMQYRYLPNGFKISVSPGISDMQPGESETFDRMVALERAKDWSGLLDSTEQEIRKVGDWAMPHALRAYALKALGRNAESLAEFNLFINQTEGDIRYDEYRRKAIASRDAMVPI